MTLRVLCTSRSGTGRCEGLGSSVFRQPVHRMAAPQGCPAPLPVPGSPGEDAQACLRTRLPRLRNAAYAPHVPVLLRVRLPFWGQVSAQSAPAGCPPRRYPRLSAVDAPCSAGGACGTGKVLRGVCGSICTGCPSSLPQFTALKFQFNTHAKRAAINLVVSIKYCLF